MSNDFPEPRLEHVFDLHADLEAPQMIPNAPSGTRQIFVVKGGWIEGPNLKGEALPGGGDWALVRTDGAIQLDVRASARLDDGALLYMYYSGLIVANQEVFGRIFGGEDVPTSDYYFYTTPMFQVGAGQHSWLNQVVAIGRGRIVPGAVEYRVWAVRNP